MRADSLQHFAERKAQETLRFLGNSGVICRVFLVPDEEMERIRNVLVRMPQFKGREAEKIKKEECINVLTFGEPRGFPHPETSRKLLGEVYINSAYVGKSKDILLRLLIHGILHLSGYRHFYKRDMIKMEKKEKDLYAYLRSR